MMRFGDDAGVVRHSNRRPSVTGRDGGDADGRDPDQTGDH